jgi:hypothetical protein
MAKDHDLPGGTSPTKPNFRTHMIPSLGSPQDLNLRASSTPLARDHSSETVDRIFVAAR